MKNLGLIPIRNFASLGAGYYLYRSAQPMYSYEYKWLKDKLDIGLVINLRSELRHDSMMAPAHDIAVVNFDVPDHFCPTLKQAHEFIELIKNRKEAILFHCEHGHGRTSTFCVLARLAQGWTLGMAIREESEKFGYEFKHPDQLKFLKDNFSNYNKISYDHKRI